jgi:hypothetical protein
MPTPPDSTSSPAPGRLSSMAARLRRRPWLTALAAIALSGLLVVVLVWFQPQALFIDDVVDEAFPAAAPTDPAPAEEPTGTEAEPADEPTDTEPEAAEEPTEAETEAAEEPTATEPEVTSEPVALATGSFTSRNRYTVTGDATTYRLEDGSRVLRLEELMSSNGPDLYVYLTAADSADSDADLDADWVDLGRLTGNIGNQNYAIPDDVDLDRYDTVVIWCRRFSSGFGAADLLGA